MLRFQGELSITAMVHLITAREESGKLETNRNLPTKLGRVDSYHFPSIFSLTAKSRYYSAGFKVSTILRIKNHKSGIWFFVQHAHPTES